MPVAALNHRAPKFAELSAVMMFGILPENHSARVAKSQPELAVAMKTTVQLALHVSTTKKHQPAHHAPVVMMRHQVVPVVTMLRLVPHVHIEMKLQLAHLANTTTKHPFAHHEQSVTKFMHQSLDCHARRQQLSA
jgi:hypothetical protein